MTGPSSVMGDDESDETTRRSHPLSAPASVRSPRWASVVDPAGPERSRLSSARAIRRPCGARPAGRGRARARAPGRRRHRPDGQRRAGRPGRRARGPPRAPRGRAPAPDARALRPALPPRRVRAAPAPRLLFPGAGDAGGLLGGRLRPRPQPLLRDAGAAALEHALLAGDRGGDPARPPWPRQPGHQRGVRCRADRPRALLPRDQPAHAANLRAQPAARRRRSSASARPSGRWWR